MNIGFFNLESWQQEYLVAHPTLTGSSVNAVFFDHILSPDTLPEQTNLEGVSVFVDSIIDASVIAALPQLSFINTRSTGYDHIDLEAARARSITVSTVPSYGEHTVAEYAFALLLTLSRKIYDAYHRIRETGIFSVDGLRGFDLKGKTLGVVGTGNIGSNVIKIAKGFGMHVMAFDVRPNESLADELKFTYHTLDEVLRNSDVVTLHVPYLESTHHLLNADNIPTMKQGAYIINTSRGQVVETEALVRALEDEHLAGAGLDVLEEEGAVKDELEFFVSGHPNEQSIRSVLANHLLIDHPRVIVTPHNAFNTTEALYRILDVTAENIASFVSGKPQNTVS